LSTEFYLVGRVRRAHGIRGELVVESLTDAPDAIFAAGRRVFAGTRSGDLAPGQPELQIVRSQPFKGGFIVAFEGIADRTTAETWRDRTLLVPESEIEPPADDQLFIHDLLGMRVSRVNGDEVGEVTDVFELPQGLVIEVRRPRGDSVLLPFDDHTVTSVDAERRTILVDPVEGLVD
jgi:16S rRNA processing protein RimM